MDINLVQTVRKIDFHNNTMIFNIQKRIALQPDEGSIIDPLNFMFDTLSKKLSSFERITPDIKSNYWYELSEKFGFKIIKKKSTT